MSGSNRLESLVRRQDENTLSIANVAEMAKRGGEELAEFLVRHDSYFVEE